MRGLESCGVEVALASGDIALDVECLFAIFSVYLFHVGCEVEDLVVVHLGCEYEKVGAVGVSLEEVLDDFHKGSIGHMARVVNTYIPHIGHMWDILHSTLSTHIRPTIVLG